MLTRPSLLWWLFVILAIIGCGFVAGTHADESPQFSAVIDCRKTSEIPACRLPTVDQEILDDKKRRLACLECATHATILGCDRECAAYREPKAKVRMRDGSDVELQALIDEVERTRPLVKGFRAIIAQQKKTIDELRAKVKDCRR